MDTLSQMRSQVQINLTVGSESSLYTSTVIDAAINSAYRKAGGLYAWSELADAKSTPTQAGYEYYDIPSTWRSDSVAHIEIAGVQWGEEPDGSPMDWSDYKQWRADTANANSTEKKWSVFKRRVFIYPVPTTTGDLESETSLIDMWGQENVETLSLDADETIFSGSMVECNEAIVLEATAILKAKGDEEQKGQFRSVESLGILTNAWTRTKSSKTAYEKVNPYLNSFDMFGNGGQKGKDMTGRF